MGDIVFNEKKFTELVLYVAARCEADRYFGATKLNKILFFADFLAYHRTGNHITGAEYFALQYGPAPRPMKAVQERMVAAGELTIDRRTRQQRPLALRRAKLAGFSAEEISLVDEVVEALREQDATLVSVLSHAFLGWQAAWAEYQATGKRVRIPYSTAGVFNHPMDAFEESEGLQIARRHGWRI